MLAVQSVDILTSFISKRFFRIKQEIKAGVSQDTILVPILYFLNTSDLPLLVDIVVTPSADNTSLFEVGQDQEKYVRKLQIPLSVVLNWTKPDNERLNIA